MPDTLRRNAGASQGETPAPVPQWLNVTHRRPFYSALFGGHGERLVLVFGRSLVEIRLHLRLQPVLGQRLFVLLAKERILQPVRDRGSALGHVDRALVGVLLTWHARLVFAVVVGA